MASFKFNDINSYIYFPMNFVKESSNLKGTITHAFEEYWSYMIHSFQNPNLYNPLIYLLLIYIVTFVFEQIFPKQIQYPVIGRKGFWMDLLYVLVMDYLIEVIGFYAMASGLEFITLKILHQAGISIPLIHLHTSLSPVLRFIVFFILIDFLQWLAHYILHRSTFMWQFHKIHHAQETLGFASTRHFHFGEYLILKPAFWIPFALCGFQAGNYIIWYIWIAYFLTFFSHCNIKLNWGPLKYIFITPETHYWHHSKNIPGKYGVNYASSLVLWDLLFGFFFNPKDKLPVLGIPQNDVPDTFHGQLIYPFKAILNLNESPAQNKDFELKETKLNHQKSKKSKK